MQPTEPQSITPLQPVSVQKHDARWVFLNAHGLRAGWSVLVFAAVIALTQLIFRWMLHPLLTRLADAAGFTHGANPPMPLNFMLPLELTLVSSVLLATAFLARIEQRAIFAYGFQGKGAVVRFISGLFYGFLAISAFVGVLARAGLLHLDGRLLHGSKIWLNALGWGIFFVIVAAFEEALFRGYLQFTLTRGIGFWWGALLVNCAFGFSHGTNVGETPVGLVSAGAIGLILCLTLWYTGSLWWALGFHAAWDWGESYVYGTSDSGALIKGRLFAEHPTGSILWSGGITGPEGSLLVLPLLAIIALCVWLWWRDRTDLPFRGAGWKPSALLHPWRSS